MKRKEFKMPSFGVGPIYVITCLILTIAGTCLHLKGYLYQGELRKGKIIFIIIGILFIMLGLYLWIEAVIVQKINKKDMFIKDVETLSKMIINVEIGNLLNDSYITGSSYIYQTTQFPGTDIKYHNYYLLIRVGSYFGACSFVENQTKSEMAALLSGTKLKDEIESDILPVKIAAMDSFLGNSFPMLKNWFLKIQRREEGCKYWLKRRSKKVVKRK